ncbi:MAG: MoxR family ATPase [Nitrospinota bacterium]|nr:MAG: MoxR family ATPase [Nitrospinota bacterium]
MTVQEVLIHAQQILQTLGTVIVGKEEALRQILVGILADGHILIEDVPGVAKTLIARLFAQVMGLRFQRIQFTPDLLPGDVTGGFIFNQKTVSFEFRPGPVFTNLLLADEINRATPKTQAALLEAMQEYQVTIEGERFPLDPPFLVMATQNPIEFEGTYPLPEAQLDRFLMRISIGYPSRTEERDMLQRRQERRRDTAQLAPLLEKETLLAMQQAIETVYVSPEIEQYIADLVWETRTDNSIQIGASPRGSLALFKLSRAYAVLEGRDFVTPDDVKAMAVPALAHRIVLQPELWARQVEEASLIEAILQRVPTPKTEQ